MPISIYQDEDKKKARPQKMSPIIITLLLLVLIAGLAFVFKSKIPWLNRQYDALVEVQAGANIELPPVVDKGSVQVLNTIGKLERCGSWPVVGVEKSADRGDPFEKKQPAAGTAAQAVTSTAAIGGDFDCVAASSQ